MMKTVCFGAAEANVVIALARLKHGLPSDSSLFAQGDINAFLSGERDVGR